jgi:phospholipase C
MQRFFLLRLLRLTPYAKQIEAIDDGPPAYDRLGFRVPAVIVSPYARPGYVTSTVYDHTSILKLIERKWNLPPLTRRDAAATDPLDALDLENPPRFLTPPTLPEPARQWHG